MAWIRAYVDKANGEHSRIVDLELDAEDFGRGESIDNRGVIYLKESGRKKLKLRKGETADHFAELTFPDQAHVE